MRARGQTSIEMLLVISFVIVVVLAIVTPYIENQNKTNAAYVAKLTILPFVEKNYLRVKINHIVPQVIAGNSVQINITTNGNWDKYVDDELNIGVNGHPPGCLQVCTAVAALGAYSRVDINWFHADQEYCGGIISCIPSLGCGDGFVDPTTVPPEACDDGANVSGDGCSSSCTVESGWVCSGSPSVCAPSGGGSPYVDVDILSTALSALPATVPLNSNASVTVSLTNLVASDPGYSEMSSVQLNTICEDLPGAGDLCETIDNTNAGYDKVVNELLVPSAPKVFLAPTVHVIQRGTTTGDTLVSAAYALVVGYAGGSPPVAQQIPGDIMSVTSPPPQSPIIVYNYAFTPLAMGLQVGHRYKFISISHIAHFNYSASNPVVLNGAELMSDRGNNIQTLTFDVVP